MARLLCQIGLVLACMAFSISCHEQTPGEAAPTETETTAAQEETTPLSDPNHPIYLVAWAAIFVALFFSFRYFDPPARKIPKQSKPKGPKPSVGKLMEMQVGKMKEISPGTKIGTKLIDRVGDQEWYMSLTSVDKSTVRDEETVEWQHRRRTMIRNFYLIAVLVAIFTALLMYSGYRAYLYFYEPDPVEQPMGEESTGWVETGLPS